MHIHIQFFAKSLIAIFFTSTQVMGLKLANNIGESVNLKRNSDFGVRTINNQFCRNFKRKLFKVCFTD